MKSMTRAADARRVPREIDEIDRRLVELLNERTAIVEEIGRAKREAEIADL